MLSAPALVMLAVVGMYQPVVVEIRPIRLHTFEARFAQSVLAVRFSQDGKTLVATGQNFSLRVWDVPAKEPWAEERYDSAEQSKANLDGRSIAVSAGGKRAFVGSGKGVQVWSLNPPDFDATLEVREKERPKPIGCTRVNVSPDGNQLVVVTNTKQDAEVQLWDTATLKKGSTLACKERVVSAVYSADGKRLVASGENRAYMWDTKTEKLLREFTTTDDDPRARGGSDTLAVSPSADWIAFGTQDQHIALCPTDEKAGGETRIRGDEAMFSADGKHLFVVPLDFDDLEVWEVATRKKVATVAVSLRGFRAMTLSPDGKRFAIGYDNGKIIVWDAASMLPKK